MNFRKPIIVFAICFALAINSLFAQQYTPFPTSNAYWLEYVGWFEIGWDQKYYLSGDTILGNQTYSKVYSKHEHGINDTVGGEYVGCIREDSLKRVYYLAAQETEVPCLVNVVNELILYDFSAQVGDTLSHLIDPAYYPYLDTLLYVRHIVTDIDSVEVLGEFRKRFAFYTYEPMANSRYGYWIEGVGSTLGLLSPIHYENCGPGFFTTGLVCFFQNAVFTYSPWDHAYCNTVGINNTTSGAESLELYPNPTTHTLNIRYSTSNFRYSMCIYDLFGRQMYEIQIPVEEKGIQVDVSSYPAGVYFIALKNEKGIVNRKKFIVK
jgi:hypothetical protein